MRFSHLGLALFLVSTSACKKTTASAPKEDFAAPATATPAETPLPPSGCPVYDTPSFTRFVRSMIPAPRSAADVYAALRLAGCSLTDQVGLMSDRSVQPADLATNSPRSFVTVSGSVICSTGPEGRIELATFPVRDGKHQPTTDEQFADISFGITGPQIHDGAEAAGCDSCHFGYVPVAIGADEDGRPTVEQPFSLRDWFVRYCGFGSTHGMCANVRAMLGE